MDVEVRGQKKPNRKFVPFVSRIALTLGGEIDIRRYRGLRSYLLKRIVTDSELRGSLFEQGFGRKCNQFGEQGIEEAFACCDLQMLTHAKHQRQASATKEMEHFVKETVNNSRQLTVELAGPNFKFHSLFVRSLVKTRIMHEFPVLRFWNESCCERRC